MADLKVPELNVVNVVGNLTKDPVFRTTNNGASVVNFHIAVNRSYKNSRNERQEDVCFVGVVAWNKLADSCKGFLQKGSAVLVTGELQSRTFKIEGDRNLTIVEIKAQRIQFLNKGTAGDETEDENYDEESGNEENVYEDNDYPDFEKF